MNNLDLEIQQLDEKRQMRNLANAIKLADSFSLLFVRCNQRPRQKEIIEELQKRLDGFNIKIVFLENQVEHLLDELQARLGDEKPDAIFVYGLESSFPKAETAAESPFVVTLNHARNSFKRVLDCPLVLFLPEYALSAIYHGATDFYSIRSGVYLFSVRAEETERLISQHTSEGERKLRGLLFLERENRIKTIEGLLAEYQSLPSSQRNYEKEKKTKQTLAELYFVSGKYDAASNIYQTFIENARKSGDSVLLTRGLSGLAKTYYEQNKYKEAVKLHKEAIKIVKETLGTEHPIYATEINNLAVVYQAQGKYGKALKLFNEALEIERKTNGTKHPNFAATLNNLGANYQRQGKYDKAVELHEESLKIAKEILGTRHLDYANRLNNLAMAYLAQGKNQKALRMLEEAYRICTRVLGENHYHTEGVKRDTEIIREKIMRQARRLVPYKN